MNAETRRPTELDREIVDLGNEREVARIAAVAQRLHRVDDAVAELAHELGMPPTARR